MILQPFAIWLFRFQCLKNKSSTISGWKETREKLECDAIISSF